MKPQRSAPRTALYALAALGLAIVACQGLALGPTPTPTRPPTATATFTPSPSPTFPPTYTPVFTPTPEPLTAAFTSQCEAAFGRAAQDGQLQLPLLALVNVVYQGRGWERSSYFPHLQTLTLAEARSLVCSRTTRSLMFYYTDGRAGYRLRSEVRVILLPEGKVIYAEDRTGENPPEVKFGSGDAYGTLATGDLKAWLYEAAGDPSIIYNGGAEVSGAALSPDGGLLALALPDSPAARLRLWDLGASREAGEWTLPDVSSEGLVFSPDGQTLAFPVGVIDPVTSIVDAATGRQVAAVSGANPAFSADGLSIFTQEVPADLPFDRIVRWDAVSGALIEPVFDYDLFGLPVIIMDFAVSSDGETLVIGTLGIPGQDADLIIWDIAGRQLDRTLRSPENELGGWGTEQVALSPDGRLLASADLDGIVTLFDFGTDTPLGQLGPFSADPTFPAGVRVMAFSPDSRFLAAGADDYTVRVWDTTTLLEVHTFIGHIMRITMVAFSPDGRTLFSASQDGTVKLWDLAAP